jgi:hypothetical protein
MRRDAFEVQPISVGQDNTPPPYLFRYLGVERYLNGECKYYSLYLNFRPGWCGVALAGAELGGIFYH